MMGDDTGLNLDSNDLDQAIRITVNLAKKLLINSKLINDAKTKMFS
jgi:hypothetical protein